MSGAPARGYSAYIREDGTVQIVIAEHISVGARSYMLPDPKPISFDDYIKLRIEHPEYNLPSLEGDGHPNGNTIGKVAGQPEPSDKPAEESNPPIEIETDQEQTWATQADAFLNANPFVEAGSYVPFVGGAIESGRAAIAIWQGNYAGAAEHLANVLPIGKWAGALFKGGKALFRLGKGQKAAKEAEKIVEQKPSGKKVGKSKKKPKCGKLATYGQQAGDFAGNLMERDHIPNKAALKTLAEDIVNNSNIELKAGDMRRLLAKVERHGPTIAIPKEIHEAGVTHSNPNNARDKGGLQASVKRDLKRYREEFAKNDKHKDCIEGFEKASKTLENITDRQYEDWINGLIDDVIQGKNTSNSWKDIF